MSLQTNLTTAFTNVGTQFKLVRTSIGTLSSLATTDKSSLVAAINEVNTKTASAGASINDTTASGTTVYSSNKTNAQVAAAVANLVASAPTTLDTLKELSDALGGDAAFATTVTTALGNRLRFDAAQTLTAPQKVQGNANLGSASLVDVGDPNYDFAAAFAAALV